MVKFIDYIEEKNKFHTRRPKRKFKTRGPQYKKPFYKELLNVEPRSAGKHSANMIRGGQRKTLSQLSRRERIFNPSISMGVSPSTEKLVSNAKKSPGSFIRKLTKREVMEIATKYKFNVPDQKKKIKHLGATGIKMFRKAPNQYYLIKTAY